MASYCEFVDMITWYGDRHYLQFCINGIYWIYEFVCYETASKIKLMTKYSAWRALNKAKSECIQSFKSPNGDNIMWNGRDFPRDYSCREQMELTLMGR
jgi:hypothetical protein